MKILVFNGSPKKEKSDTLCITNAFLGGMAEKCEYDIRFINAVDCNVKPCTGCLQCMRNGGHCMLNDDMEGILKSVSECDIMLFSFPLYCYGMPAPLKAIIDRFLPFSSFRMEKSGEGYAHPGQSGSMSIKTVMICGCGFPNSKQNFEGMIKQFELLFGKNSICITVPEAPMFNVPKALPATRPLLEKVAAAGREFAETGILRRETVETLSQPMIPEEVYAAICNGETV